MIVPSKPTALTATPICGHESSQVRITWQPPRHLAGVLPERLKYLARIHRASNQVAALTVPFMTLEWVYADLDANVSYRISVQTVDEFRAGGGLSVLEYRTAVADTCSAGQFTCRPGACISRSLTCDGTANCADAADETTDAGCPLPSSISSLQQVNVGWNTIEVSWRPLPASNYLLFYVLSALAATSSQLYRLHASSTSHVITSLVDNTSYNVSIIGKNLAGFGPSTQIVVKTLELKRPSVPQGVTLESPPGWEASRLRLLWLAPVDFGNALPSEISYELTVCEVSVSDKFLSCAVTGSVSSPHLVVDLNSNTTYEIIIAAVNSRRMYGSSYTIRHHTALKNKTPTAPSEVVINKNDLDESVTLTWNHPLDTAGTNRTQLTYRLRYCHASDAVNCAHVDLPTGVLNYTLRNLLPGSSYTVQIVALNFRNEEGSPITLIINTKSTSDVGLQGGEIAGIVLGCVVFVAIIVSALVIRKSERGTLLTQPKPAEFSLASRNPSVL